MLRTITTEEVLAARMIRDAENIIRAANEILARSAAKPDGRNAKAEVAKAIAKLKGELK